MLSGIPSPQLPEPPALPTPNLELPGAQLPSYVPLQLPPSSDGINVPAGEGNAASQEEKQEKKAAPPLAPPITVPELQVPQQLFQAQDQTPDVQPEIQSPPSTAEATFLTLPGTDVQIPVPKAEIIAAAGVTSVVSVGAALAATSIFKQLVSAFKPVLNAASKRIAALRKKPHLTFGRTRLLLRRHRRLHKAKTGGSHTLPS